MVWLFERGEGAVRGETRCDSASEGYVLILHRRTGSETERFDNAEAFRARLEHLEQQLERERWNRTGPFFLRDGWRV